MSSQPPVVVRTRTVGAASGGAVAWSRLRSRAATAYTRGGQPSWVGSVIGDVGHPAFSLVGDGGDGEVGVQDHEARQRHPRARRGRRP